MLEFRKNSGVRDNVGSTFGVWGERVTELSDKRVEYNITLTCIFLSKH
jgi:hypothetical protein